eukprot:NODE_53_length_30760_cov_1.203712.p14 type:complete len:231 gc:universal NODE_53_length_30760_cov_1.203712:27301-27993(+)
MVWYLAYGSNMNKDILIGRRKINPTDSRNVIIHDYQLSFNVPGIPFIEPSFASILPRKGCLLHGVAFEISEKDFLKIQHSEGGQGIRGISYQPIEIEAESYDGKKFVVRTLYYSCSIFPNIKEFHPSKRYLNLIIEGAKQNKLDSHYLQMLENLEYYETNDLYGNMAKYLFAIPSLSLAPFLLSYFILAKYFHYRVNTLIFVAHYIQYFLYLFHDLIFSKIFPSGLVVHK